MAKVALTDRKFQSLKAAPESKRYQVMDSIVPGFGVRVTDKGVKTQARFKPVTEGVIEGLKRYFDGTNNNPKVGGYKPISYDPDGGGGGLGGGSRGGVFGSKEYPALDPNTGQKPGGAGKFGPETSGGDANSNAAGLGGSDYLNEQRARFAEELKRNPKTRKELAAAATLEGNPANVAEALMNRMAYTHSSPGGHAGAARFREEQQRQVLNGAAKTPRRIVARS
jgi:hypothetical protein